eukprot:TRINITY_DN35897_c0_g1_i1.p1 TRINITY_DN35897_c0_g1~~TRINITY_DN35897_c0_g1_i1.p1  ORF type:complete len:236 (+),score=96.36 TRINITY_DN35897_c0_g1_i1:43-708(+)
MASRLASLGIKRAVGVSAAAPSPAQAQVVRRVRKLASPGSFPKGRGMRSALAEDLSTKVPVKLVAMSGDEAAAAPGGKKVSALQRRMQQTTKEILTVTEDAAKVISNLLRQKDDSPLGVRVGVQKKGCNGLGYTMDFLYPEYLDEHGSSRFGPSSTTQHGVTVLVEPDAFMHVVGTVMDYHIDKASEKFVFLNPNSEGSCGCGESFVSKGTAETAERAAHA